MSDVLKGKSDRSYGRLAWGMGAATARKLAGEAARSFWPRDARTESWALAAEIKRRAPRPGSRHGRGTI